MSENVLNVQITADDYLAANRLHSNWYKILSYLSVVALLAATMPLVLRSAIHDWPLDWSFRGLWSVGPYLLILSFYLVSLRYVILPWRTRKLYRQQKSLQRPQKISWTEEHLSVQGEGFSSEAPWSDYMRWREDEKIFSLYLSDVMFRIIPKRAFSDVGPIDEFRELLRRKIAPKEGQKRNS